MNIRSQLILLLFIFVCFFTQAQNIPKPMSPARMVNDFSGIFSQQERDNLELLLRNYQDTTSTQIYVVTINDIEGYAISDYAFRLGEEWGIGQKNKNNGAVILIKPKVGNSRGQVYIATGYGLEEKLTDARVGRIIDNSMIPYFSQGDYYTGTKSAIEVMINYLSGQFQSDPNDDGKISFSDIVTLIFIVVLFIYLKSKSKNNKGNKSNRGGGFFPPVVGGGFGSRSSGSSSRGGSGSFRGGGGGSFGGGGAGRSW